MKPAARSSSFGAFLAPISNFLSGDTALAGELAGVLGRVDSGEFDREFATELDPHSVYLTTSCHLLAMSLRHRIEGLKAQDFYKSDPLKYVRSNLFIQRAIGIERLTLGWPVYAFGAEAIGQTMMYPDDQAPGSDPGEPMLSLERPDEIPEYDPDSEVAGVIRDTLKIMSDLAGIEPVAHLPAPYSLAAEIVGQENLILALSGRPDLVVRFLDVLVDRVLAPWCVDLHKHLPAAWLELSDASGSPMFIGPRNFLAIATEPVLKLRKLGNWGARVFVANYRGDRQRARSTSSSRATRQKSTIGFAEMTDAKRACCPWFLTRLEADHMAIDDYVEFCERHGMTFYAGIGATRVDKNSISDSSSHQAELASDLRERHDAVLGVRRHVLASGAAYNPSWPGDLYLEDTNAESDLELINWIANSGYQNRQAQAPGSSG